ncbi:MAG: hypothetical protein R2851_02725 [Caldilineaceae bacterium]
MIYGDGLQSRDFTFVANNIAANLLATTVPGVGGQVFNIACGRRYTLLDLVERSTASCTRIEPEFRPASGDVKHSLADITQAETGLGYRVQVDFEAGLAQTVAWYLQGGSGLQQMERVAASNGR